MNSEAFQRVVDDLPQVQYMPREIPMRQLLTEYLGKTLTPELAASIDLLARKQVALCTCCGRRQDA